MNSVFREMSYTSAITTLSDLRMKTSDDNERDVLNRMIKELTELKGKKNA